MTFKKITIAIIVLFFAGEITLQAEEMSPKKIPFPRPDSHKGGWLKLHGASANLNLVDGTKACLICHRRADCIECHNLRAPRDHTNTWRILSHGFMASGNKDRCLNCHRQDYCVRCHNETAPRSHRANWIQRHCLWCHFESGIKPAEGCVVCHKTAPHTSAPHPVNSGLNCWRCHR